MAMLGNSLELANEKLCDVKYTKELAFKLRNW
jgi:hypothetical protein